MTRFVINKRHSGEYQFYLKADNGEIILTSEGFISKTTCRDTIHVVKQNAPFDQFYDRKISSNGKFYFVLKGSNGLIIGNSELYESQAGREYGIISVKRNAPVAQIESNN